jgi:hypothetical protein
MTGEITRSIRSAGAHDGRAASQRIDKVEAQQRWALEVVAEALGADTLKLKLGHERALAFLEAAGWSAHKVEQIGAKWEADRRERERSVSQQTIRSYGSNGGYQGDPMHDERVVSAVMRGAPAAELHQIAGTVTREYREQAAEAARQAARTQNVLWQGRDGPVVGNQVSVPLGVASDPRTGNPRQVSVVHRGVAELGSEPVGATPMGDVRPVSMTCTAHPGKQGDRYCAVCGKPRPQAPAQPEEAAG